MDAPEPPFPFRKATRLVNRFQTEMSKAGFAIVPRQPVAAVLVMALLRHALREGDGAPVSALALARSLKQATETVRRTMHLLCALGLCERRGARFVLAADFAGQPRVAAAYRQVEALFAGLVADCARFAVPVPSVPAHAPRADRLVAALDIYLSAFELAEMRLTDVMQVIVVGPITVANAAGITDDPALMDRYAFEDTVPPPELRRPVSIRQVAAVYDLPYATIWRQVARAAAAGRVRKVLGGYLLSEAWMDSAAVNALSRVRIGYVRRVLGDLGRSEQDDC